MLFFFFKMNPENTQFLTSVQQKNSHSQNKSQSDGSKHFKVQHTTDPPCCPTTSSHWYLTEAFQHVQTFCFKRASYLSVKTVPRPDALVVLYIYLIGCHLTWNTWWQKQIYPFCNNFFWDTNACASSWLVLEQEETRKNCLFPGINFWKDANLHSLPLIRSR